MNNFYETNPNIPSDFDFTKVKPYGDTLNDGKVQVSFTLPLKDCEKSKEAAKQTAEKWVFRILL